MARPPVIPGLAAGENPEPTAERDPWVPGSPLRGAPERHHCGDPAPMTEQPFLRIERLWKRFGAFTALKAIDLEVRRGEFVCFLGPSGCGKTTLLRAIAGLDPQDEGRIEMSPFGGIKDSGLGYKEGVVEAMKSFTNVRTYSLPWPA